MPALQILVEDESYSTQQASVTHDRCMSVALISSVEHDSRVFRSWYTVFVKKDSCEKQYQSNCSF